MLERALAIGSVSCQGLFVEWAKFAEGLHPDPPDLKELADEKAYRAQSAARAGGAVSKLAANASPNRAHAIKNCPGKECPRGSRK